ncbi:hypothetical protein DYY66_1014 [Candidatus Nitrosotalea sp. FS]|nr:hypothetical protein [Candidatus Nitrosotalea sp. FS]
MSNSAIDWSSANALDIMTPPPARIIGLSADKSISVARSICVISGSTHGWYPLTFTSFGKCTSASFCCTSFGMSINTGPGLPVDAM